MREKVNRGASTYLDIDVILVDVGIDTFLAIVSLVAPDLAMLIGPRPVFRLLLAVPLVVPVVVLPLVVVPVVGSLDCLDLVVGLESTSRSAALL